MHAVRRRSVVVGRVLAEVVAVARLTAAGPGFTAGHGGPDVFFFRPAGELLLLRMVVASLLFLAPAAGLGLVPLKGLLAARVGQCGCQGPRPGRWP
ncbi:hypothetical protein [Streptomyces sp. SBT349]|uniref:hypothetical protein n=1 Tax=Streptomyces sp. SBT349 TaxID=1580539 RepID=UPI00066D9096|nr:hypothetical protein [Streptomyces sp. SBT349]